jgi:uncharacterized protein (DUF1330 family)
MAQQQPKPPMWRRSPRWLSRRTLVYFAGLTLSFFLGVILSGNRISGVNPEIASAGPKPAFLVASWDLIHPDQLEPFGDAVVPLAKRAGYEPLAASTPQVLEGVWPYKGLLIVQKYTSMHALQDFWNSPEHVGAKKLREGLIDSHFVVAVEAD